MINKITESTIETYTIELLEKQGYHYTYGPTIAPDSETPQRTSFEDVLLFDNLKTAVTRINPTIPLTLAKTPSNKSSVSIPPNSSPTTKPFTGC
jgi:hypothetical protein